MRSKALFACVLALLFTAGAARVSAQADYAAREGQPKLAVGGGLSIFSVDKAGAEGNAMLGPTMWVDWRPPIITHLVHGLGLEFQARDLRWNRGDISGFNEYTLGGGPIYHFSRFHFHHIQPYVKGDFAFGYVNTYPTPIPGPNRFLHHWDEVAYGLGGGADYPLARRIALRVDYEYQFWRDYPGLNDVMKTSDPNGITIGALYSFGGRYK